MSNEKKRRRWTPQKKLELVLVSMQSDTRLAELCRREGVSPNQVYQWRKQLMGSADAVFGRRKGQHREDPRQEKMAARPLHISPKGEQLDEIKMPTRSFFSTVTHDLGRFHKSFT